MLRLELTKQLLRARSLVALAAPPMRGEQDVRLLAHLTPLDRARGD